MPGVGGAASRLRRHCSGLTSSRAPGPLNRGQTRGLPAPTTACHRVAQNSSRKSYIFNAKDSRPPGPRALASGSAPCLVTGQGRVRLRSSWERSAARRARPARRCRVRTMEIANKAWAHVALEKSPCPRVDECQSLFCAERWLGREPWGPGRGCLPVTRAHGTSEAGVPFR